MKIIVLITLLLAIAYSQTTCPCDEGKFFIPAKDAGTAVCKAYPVKADTTDAHKFVENCTVYSYDQASSAAVCDACAEGHYLKEKACVANDITDCVVQADTNTCTYCKATNFKTAGTPDNCTSQVTGTVENCMYYLSATECQVCNDGYNLNTSDKTKCVKETTVENCSVQGADANGVSNCSICKDTHPILTEGKCSEVKNCTKYAANACTECKANFFLNSATPAVGCTAYPEDGTKIGNCEVYVTKGTALQFQCGECATGFFVNAEDPNACTAIPTGDDVITDCVEYITTGSGVAYKCADCGATKFVNDDGTACLAYPTTDKATTNCSVYISNGSNVAQCSECESKFLLKADFNCVDEVTNEFCEEFSIVATKQTCSGGCVAGAYENLDSNCAKCPELESSGDDDDDDDDEEEDKDKNNSASVASVCMGLVSVALIAIL